MWIIIRASAVGLVMCCSGDVVADGIFNPGVSGSVFGDGINNSAGMSVGPPQTPCNAGQLDFSDACNTTQYMVILR